VEPLDQLQPAERLAIDRLSQAGPGPFASSGAPPFRLQLVDEPPWSDRQAALLPDEGPALVEWVEGRVRVTHFRFMAELDPFARRGRLFRRGENSPGLEVSLRTALSSCLPLEGGLPLHAAGLVANENGLVFFGPSGAGKSTLSGLSPHPVVSDELVAVVGGAPFRLASTGFWGAGTSASTTSEPAPLRALIELDKGDRFRLDRLDPREGLRRLIPVVMVPNGPPLWSEALAVLGRLVRQVPVYRMAWSPAHPPWAALAETLAEGA
jgi:hypothetical protein